jgi:nucleotide-binding universal stress UspA family protein
MNVLIGVDDSVCSRAAVAWVKGASWPKGTHFIVISASPPVFVGPGEAAAPGGVSELIAEESKLHREIAEKAAAELKSAGLSAEGRSVLTDPRAALDDEARKEKADLIVVGSHGRSGITKLLLGSVATHIVTHAPCSVLVVKRPSL